MLCLKCVSNYLGEIMRYLPFLPRCASSAFMVLGLGHLLTTIVMQSKHANVNPVLFKLMSETHIHFPGRAMPVRDLMDGFSLAMGVLLFAYGLQSWRLPQLPIQFQRQQAIQLAFVATLICLISLRYFFIVPITLSAIGALCWGIFAIQMKENTHGAPQQ